MDVGEFNHQLPTIVIQPLTTVCIILLSLLCSRLSREIDTVLRVAAVKACVGAKFALAVSEKIYF